MPDPSAVNPKDTNAFAHVGLICGRFRDMDADDTVAAVATRDGGVARLTYGDLRTLLTEAFSAGDRLQRIAAWHSRESAPGGMVGDYCNECGHVWPCDTRRMADGTYVDEETPMPDPSADRPLLLPEEPFTEEDVSIVEGALTDWLQDCCIDGGALSYDGGVRRALTALAAAGRLLPADADRDEEWTVRYTMNGDPKPPEWGGHVFSDRDEAELHIATWRRVYPDLTYTDVHYLQRDLFTGPWVEVDRSPDA